MEQMKEYVFEQVEVNGKLYEVETTIAYDAGMVDNGIGPYEFWGARGTDVRWEFVVDKWEVYSVDKVKDEHDNVMPEGTVTTEDVEHWLNMIAGVEEIDFMLDAVKVEVMGD